MDATINNSYYTSRKQQLLKGLEKIRKTVAESLKEQFSGEFADEVFLQAKTEFEKIIPDLPDIGGKKNPYTQMVILSATGLAIFLALKVILKNTTVAKRVTFGIFKIYIDSRPKILGKVLGAWMFTKFSKNRMKRLAERSQKKEFADDYVFEYVEGDGKSFDFGLNFTECASCKLHKKMGEPEFSEVICATDCLRSEAYGWGLTRTTTIGQGGPKCDFRFKKNAETNVVMPDFLEDSEKKEN